MTKLNVSGNKLGFHNYETLEAAMINSKAGDEISVNQSIIISHTIKINHTIMIDFNDNIVNVLDGVSGFNLYNGKLMIKNANVIVGQQCNFINKNSTSRAILQMDRVEITHEKMLKDGYYPVIVFDDKQGFGNVDLILNNCGIDCIYCEPNSITISGKSNIGNAIARQSYIKSPVINISDSQINNTWLNNVDISHFMEMKNLSTTGNLMINGNVNIDGFSVDPLPLNDEPEISKSNDKLNTCNLIRSDFGQDSNVFALIINGFDNQQVNVVIKEASFNLEKLINQKNIYMTTAWFFFGNCLTKIINSKIIKTVGGLNCQNGGYLSMIGTSDEGQWQRENVQNDINFEETTTNKANVNKSQKTNSDNTVTSNSQEKVNFQDSDEDALQSINSMIGLESVKKEIDNVIKLALVDVSRNSNSKVSINLVFEGNPGTGKTAVARLFSKALYQNHVIDSYKFIEVSATELLGGQGIRAAESTRNIVNKAIGGVLFIDEAYALDPGQDNNLILEKEAVNQLIKSITDVTDSKQQLIVIMAGYTDKMEHLFEVANKGLSTRFSKSNRIVFPDYTPDELIEIFKLDLKKDNLTCDESALDIIKDTVERLVQSDNASGNGRFVKNDLVERLKKFQAVRLSEIGINNLTQEQKVTITEEDAKLAMAELLKANNMNVDANGDQDGNALSELDTLIGLEPVKNQVKSLIMNARLNRIREKKFGSKVETGYLNMVFEGNPGTGKTMVARLVAKALFQNGVTSSNKFEEISATDLVAGYRGQSAPLTQKVIDKAIGGVLFIDEAYNLEPEKGSKDFKQDVVDKLVQAITSGAKLVIIMAGYTKEMEHFIDFANKGLRSRFPYIIEFPDYDVTELMDIYKLKISKSPFNSTDDANNVILEMLNQLKQNNLIDGNGRFISNVISDLQSALSTRLSQIADLESLPEKEINTITKDDAMLVMKDYLNKDYSKLNQNVDNNTSYQKDIDAPLITVNDQEYSTLVQAVQYSQNGDVITVNDNVEANGIIIDKDLTIRGAKGGIIINMKQCGLGHNNGSLKIEHVTLLVDSKSNALLSSERVKSISLFLNDVTIKHKDFSHDNFYQGITYSFNNEFQKPVNANVEIIDSNVDSTLISCKNLKIINSKIGNSITSFSQLSANDIQIENTNLNNILISNLSDNSALLEKITTDTPLFLFGNFKIDGLEVTPLHYDLYDQLELINIKKPFDSDMNALLGFPENNGSAHFAINIVNLDDNKFPHVTIKDFSVKDVKKIQSQNQISNIISWFNVIKSKLDILDSDIPATLSIANQNNLGEVICNNCNDYSKWNVPVVSKSSLNEQNKNSDNNFVKDDYSGNDKLSNTLDATKQINDINDQDNAKNSIIKIINLANMNCIREKNGLPMLQLNMNFIFIGNQLDVQEKLAQLFIDSLNQMSILTSNNLIDIDGSKSEIKIGEALFIKNVNLISEDLLTQLINNENVHVIIISGTKDSINDFMQNHLELEKYFPNKAVFNDNKKTFAQMLIDDLDKKGFVLSIDAQKLINDKLNDLNNENIKKDINSIINKLITTQSMRLMNKMREMSSNKLTDEQREMMVTINSEDVNSAFGLN